MKLPRVEARSLVTALLWGIGLVPFTPARSEERAGGDAFPLVTERVQSYVDRGYYPGCGVWIAQGDKVLYERCFGKFTPDTEVYIASAGKWLVAATILTVVDEGKLSLEDTVEKWLPEFRGDPKGKATLRQLLSHTSGFPPYQPEGNPKDDYQTTEESVRHLLPLPPHDPPGTRFEYGGLAMQVAGRMAEVATGEDWETIFRKRIGRPLGMTTRTHFTPVDPGHIPMLAGGAVSTLHDYSRFLTMMADGGLFGGKRILSSASIAEMESDQVRGAAVHREEFVERRRGKTHNGIYGLGVWREELDGKGNPILLSSPSWAGTYPWIDRKHDIRGLIIAHQDGAVAGPAHFSGFWSSPVLMNLVRAEWEWNAPKNLPGFRAGTVPVRGGDLAYEEAGSGDPVILLHGHSFDRRMWDPQFAELAKHYRVIRYDLRGYGLSDLPKEGGGSLHAEDLTALLDALKIPKAHVVGLSLGGYVVGDMLALDPERLLSATIASGGVFDGPATRNLGPQEWEARLAEIETVREKGVENAKTGWREALLKGAGHHGGEIRTLLSRMINDWSAWQLLHIEPRLLFGHEAIDKIAAAKPNVPVLWIAGANDRYQDSVAKFREVLPGMKLVVIPDAGHLSNLEQPQAFTDSLLSFLKKHSE
jgi:CubicO group peptidase (beta-lactamase class C family)/pimeloyl-ACP methyl ester carboxylesterase